MWLGGGGAGSVEDISSSRRVTQERVEALMMWKHSKRKGLPRNELVVLWLVCVCVNFGVSTSCFRVCYAEWGTS